MANEIEILVKSKDQTKAGTASARKNLDEIGESAKRVGEVAQGVLAANWFERLGEAAAQGVKSTFNAAKDLGESVNAVNVSFGASAGKIHEWGQNNAASFGLSTRAFNQFAVPLGAVMKNVGLDMDTVSGKTIGLTERAADMASVFNEDVSTVLEAIQAGLRGEADPLEKFGVGLSAAAVEAKALADSGKESAESLTEQEKMLARVALIMEQTSQVQGDFANTSDDAANAQRIATAEMENAQAQIGQVFLPVMALLAQTVAGLARFFGDLPAPIQAVVGVIGVLGAAFVILAPKIVAAKAALQGVSLTSGAIGGRLKGVGVVAGKAALGLTALVAASSALKAATADAPADIEAMTVGLEKWTKGGKLSGEAARVLGGDVDALTDSLVVLADGGLSKGLHHLTEFASHATPFTSELGDAEKQVAALDAALGQMVSSGDAETAAATFDRLAEAAARQGIDVNALRELLPQYAAAQEKAGAAAGDSADAQGDFADATGDSASATEDATAALEEHIDTLRAATDPVFGLLDALDTLDDAQREYNTAVKEHGANSKEARAASIDLAKAVRDVETAAANGELSWEDFQRQLRTWVKAGQLTAQQAKTIEGRVRDARREADKYGGKTTRTLRLQLRGAQAVENSIARLARERTAWITTRQRIGAPTAIGGRPMASGGISGAGHAAEGGPRGNLTLVGEQGPELIDLAPGSMVHPAGTTRNMLSAGGGTQRVVLELRSSGSRVDDLLLEILRDAISVRGGDVQVVLGQ